jgi:cell division protein FtsL
MHQLVQDTIDKVSFKINIPILVSIVVTVAIVACGYMKITTDLAGVQYGIAQILTKLSNNDTEHKILNDRINSIVERVIRIETKMDIKMDIK